MSCRAMHLSCTMVAAIVVSPAGDHDRGVVAAATPHNIFSPAIAP